MSTPKTSVERWGHTIGPWAHDGGIVWAEAPGSDLICDVRQPKSPLGRRNAALIAAAPELYEALAELVRLEETGEDPIKHNPVLAMARRALRKAREQG